MLEELELDKIDKLVILIIKHHSNIKPSRLQKISLLLYAILEKVDFSILDEIEESAQSLKEEGFVDYISGKGFILTSEGEKLAEFIERTNKNKTVKNVVSVLKNLSDNRIKEIIYHLFPEVKPCVDSS